MKHHYYIAGLVLLAGLLLASCADDPDEAKDRVISINTNISKMLTRANTIDSNSELQTEDLRIDAYFHNTDTKYLDGEKLHYDSSDPAAWKFWDGSAQLHYYWPIEGSVYTGVVPNITVSSLDFVGYCPYTTPSYITTGPTYDYSTGRISFTATMPTTEIETVYYMTSTNQADLKEFMCAITNDQTYVANSGVPLTFKHSFACVKFNLSSATTANVIVNFISLNDLKTIGSCVFDGTTSTWSAQSGSAPMKLTEVLQRGSAREESSPFLVIPNEYAAAKTLTVDFTWKEWDEEHHQVFSTPLSIDWAAGHSYTYSLTITKDDLKVDIEKFTEQW